MHPRTEKMAKQFSLYERIASIPRIRITGPVGYLDFVALMSKSKLVLTDSGGLQEETTALGIPCITLRENTSDQLPSPKEPILLLAVIQS